MPHPCSYLAGRTATTLFVDPREPLDPERFAHFMRIGFRRSGDLVYRPHCRECQECVPVRVPVEHFEPNRAQRRVWQRNQDLRVEACPAIFKTEHFDLYRRYQRGRHPGGGMDDADPQKYIGFLTSRQIDTQFYEMWHDEKLVAVAVVDHLPDGLSAVYTFYDPSLSQRSLGTYAILWEIVQARAQRLPWVYLGYWIAASPKMAYKENFRPLEAYVHGHWTNLAR